MDILAPSWLIVNPPPEPFLLARTRARCKVLERAGKKRDKTGGLGGEKGKKRRGGPFVNFLLIQFSTEFSTGFSTGLPQPYSGKLAYASGI